MRVLPREDSEDPIHLSCSFILLAEQKHDQQATRYCGCAHRFEILHGKEGIAPGVLNRKRSRRNQREKIETSKRGNPCTFLRAPAGLIVPLSASLRPSRVVQRAGATRARSGDSIFAVRFRTKIGRL